MELETKTSRSPGWVVWADNLIHGVFLALERDATGEAFNITDGHPMPKREFFGHHAS